jgi:hypothetical protein
MDAATAAVMVLLSCSLGDASICKPVNTANGMFASLSECRRALATELAGSADRRIIGRCQLVDPTVTSALPAGYKAVAVTRGGSIISYIVPHKE